MAAKLLKLPTPQGALDDIRQHVISFEDVAPGPAREFVAAIDLIKAKLEGWTFIMLGPDQNLSVMRWLREHSDRPMVAMILWAELFMTINRHTGEIMQSRKELAARVGTDVGSITRIMGQLEDCGAIIKRKEGRTVRFFMNPYVATHLTETKRVIAQSKVAPVRSVPQLVED